MITVATNFKTKLAINMRISYNYFAILVSFLITSSAYAQISVTAGTLTNGYALVSAATFVDPAIVITSSSNINGFRITISNGLKSNDVLSYTGSLPAGVSATAYNASTGILSFSGSTSATNWQTLLRTITFANSNSAQYGDRIITFSAGISSAFSNGHFYELINSSSMSWTSAKAAAAARSYLGYGGYLATITSAAENAFIKQVLGADAWIGCSDNYLQINAATGTTTYANQTASEGKWTWVTGPEKGTLFSVGNNSPVTQTGKFAYWNSGEPNNWGGSEDFGEIYSSGTGQWNDLGTGSSIGYVVEYGGLSTDPVQSITSNTTIYTLISTNTASSSQTLCNGATATAFTGSTPTGGNGTYSYSWLSSTTNASTGFVVANGTTNSINYSPGSLSVNTWYKRVVTSGTLKDTTSAIAITVDAAISTSSTQTNVNCNGALTGAASVVVSGGTSPYSYNWTPGNPTGDGTSSVMGLAAGTWICTTTDALGCTVASVFTITQPSALTVTSTQTNVSCNGGSNGSATVVANGGTTGYTYSWTPSGGSSAIASGLSTGTYTCSISDANLCPTVSSTVTITQPTLLSATTSQTNPSCNGSTDGNATITPSGGTAPFTYAWSPYGQTTATITGLFTANHACVVTDANGCTISKSISIVAPNGFGISGSQTNISCNGLTDGIATGIFTGGTTPYSYAWSPSGGIGASATNLSSGIYTCNMTDAHGCTTSKSFTISQPAVLSAAFILVNNVSCNGGANGKLIIQASGGTSSYNYAWSNGGSSPIHNSLSVGTYTCTITDSRSCTVVESNVITQPTVVAVSSSKINVSCNSGSTGSIQLTPTGGTSPYTYFWNNGITTSSLSSLAAGTYTCNVSDANSCLKSTSFTITQPSAITSTTSQTNISCNGLTDGIAGVYNVSGGTSPYNYLWDFGGINDVESSLGTGTYTCTITDANSCTLEKNFTISEPLILSASLSSTEVLCNGGSSGTATVIPTGGTTPYIYNWSDGSSTSTSTGLASNNYSVTITDNNGCQFSDVINVSEPTVLSVSISKTNATCSSLADGVATASTSGGTSPYTYQWSTGETTASISSLAAGIYSVTVTDSHNCTSNSSITLSNIYTLSSSISSTNVSCNGGNNGFAAILPSGGTTPYSYAWINGELTSSINGLSANSYSVIVTDNNGCETSNSISISEPNTISANISSVEANCFGNADGSAEVISTSGGTNPYSYAWSNGNINSTANGLIAGIYTVTITDNNGCTFNTTATVGEPSTIISNVTTTNASCNGLSDGTATTLPYGGSSPYSYAWADGQTTASAIGLAAQTLLVTITDDHGCILNEVVTIQQPTIISSSFTSTAVSCNGGSDGEAIINATGGTSPYYYSWSTGSNTNSETGLGANTFLVTITDDHGCTAIESVTVTEPQPLATSITQTNVTCNGSANGTATIVVTGGTAPYNYSWTSGDTTTLATPLDAQNYSVQIIDAKGCIQSASVLITEPIILSVNITETDVLCNAGNSGTATALGNGGTAPYSFLWSTGGTADLENNLTAGIYTVTVTDLNGCSVESNITIVEPTQLIQSTSFAAANCGQSNGSASVVASGGSGPYTYNWSSGGTADVENNLAAGNYSLIVTDVNGCSQANTISVSNIGAPSVVVSQTSVLCHGDNNGTIDLSVSGGSGNFTYTWSDGDTTASLSGLSPISYSYVVTDAANCQSTGVVTIVEPDLIVITSTTINETISNDGSIDLTVSGGVAPYSYSWSDGSSTEDLSNLASGNYTVTITDSYGCLHMETISVGSSVGINQNNLNSLFDVYPNPNNGKFNIKGNHGSNLVLKNSLGQIVKRIQLTADNHYAVSIENLSTGVYFIQNEESNFLTIKKIVVIK